MRLPPETFRYSGLGCVFAAGVFLFMAGGWLFDRAFGLFPVLTVLGALAGAALGTVSIWRRLRGDVTGPGKPGR